MWSAEITIALGSLLTYQIYSSTLLEYNNNVIENYILIPQRRSYKNCQFIYTKLGKLNIKWALWRG